MTTPDCCHGYIACIRYMQAGGLSRGSVAACDAMRKKLHDAICVAFGLSRRQTEAITDHIPDGWTGDDLAAALSANDKLTGAKN